MTATWWPAKARPEDNNHPFRFYESVVIRWGLDGDGRSKPVAVLTNGQMRGTFPPLMGDGPDGSTYLPHSRQEARHIGRALRFNAITASFYALPRRERRRLSREQG